MRAILNVATALVALVPFGITGCGSSKPQPAANIESQPTAPQQQDSGAKRYHLEGTVVSIDRQQKRVTVDGKDIPGFMAAMTMPYPVADDETLHRVKPGDQITADIVAAGSEYHLDNVVVVKPGEGK
jgi:Cu/Ag efflux protein CusF